MHIKTTHVSSVLSRLLEECRVKAQAPNSDEPMCVDRPARQSRRLSLRT